MKKIFLYFFVLAATVACNRVEGDGDLSLAGKELASGMITEIISGSQGSSTKATIADTDASFSWTKGDNIAVHVSNGTYVSTADEGASGASVSAASAQFKVIYEAGCHRDYYAIYPSALVSDPAVAANYGQAEATLDVKLPSSYTLAEVSGTTSPCPMIATNSDDSWAFYQLCSLLRLKLNSIPPSTRRLEINFNGKKVCGVFSVTSPETPGTAVIATSTKASESTITITKYGLNVTDTETDVRFNGGNWLDNQVLNIPLPTGSYSKITVTAYDALTGGNEILTMTRDFAYDATNEEGVKKTTSFPVFSINTNNANFTITSTNSRAIFARGNLRATTTDHGATWKWGFAEHQYDHLGKGGANEQINGVGTLYVENGTVDLFGWSISTESPITTSTNAYGITNSTSNSDFYPGSFVDWGTIAVFDNVTYPSTYWKTMSSGNSYTDEWWYMMRERKTSVTIQNPENDGSDARFALAVINTDINPVNGIIIFPDFYSGPTKDVVNSTNPSKKDIEWHLINVYGTYKLYSEGTQCTTAGWQALESEGCVFLPVTGHRSGNVVNRPDIEFRYSSRSKRNDNLLYVLSFYEGDDYIFWNEDQKYKKEGCAVRLVHEIKPE
jgi:hypothetical protein